jgi:predicted nuclease of predicted toxin-antitoxin system
MEPAHLQDRFLLDENAELRIGRALTALAYDVKAIAQDYPASLPDHDVLALAVAEDRILITNDRDFGELIFRQGHPHRDQLDRFLVVTPRGIRVW